MIRLLEGINVVESAVLLVGDHLGQLLGDAGADVVKIEQPGSGDYLRKILGQFAPDYSPFHCMTNRNKRSLTLDPRGAGRPVFERLIREADVFITGQVGPIPAKLGMDYESVRAINPRIVYCQTTGFGAVGPYAEIPTHGQMMEKLGGAPSLELAANGRIIETAEGVAASGVSLGPIYSAYAIAAAIIRRDRTGEGCYIDVSCSDAVVAESWTKAITALNQDKLQKAEDVATFPVDGWRGAAKYTYYQTKDEKYVLFCPIEKKFWDAFCIAAGRPDLCERHSKVTVVDYGENDFDLMDELQRLFHTRTLDEWSDLFAKHAIPGSPAVPIAEVPENPHLAARGIIVEEHHPAVGTIRTVGSPIRVNGEGFEVDRHAPALGEHTDEILTHLGFSADEIEALRAARAV